MIRRNFLQSLIGLLPTCIVGCNVVAKHEMKFKIGDKVKINYSDGISFVGTVMASYVPSKALEELIIDNNSSPSFNQNQYRVEYVGDNCYREYKYIFVYPESELVLV